MSDEQRERPQQATDGADAADAVAAPPPLPYPWVKLTLGLVALVVAAVICGVLLAQFLKIRPVNLRNETDALADAVEELLLSNCVPREHVRRTPGGLVANDTALWHMYSFKVGVPDTLSVQGIEDLLRRNMLRREVTVTGVNQGAAQRELALYLGTCRFATLRLRPLAPRRLRRQDLQAACTALADEAVAILANLGVPEGRITRGNPEAKEHFDAVWTFTRIEADLPPAVTAEDVAAQLTAALDKGEVGVTSKVGPNGRTTLEASYSARACLEVTLTPAAGAAWYEGLPPVQLPTLAQAIRELDLNEVLSIALPHPDEIELESAGLDPSEQAPPLVPVASPAPDGTRVAIIVDDGGYGGAITEAFLALDPGLTLAILPNTPAASETALRAAKRGFEVMLHMPMERARFPGRLSTDMTLDQIRQLTDNALGQIVGAVGVNNHAGSKFTADEVAMTRFIEAIKPKSLFFVDSRTTAATIAYDVAKRLGVPAVSRDVFLDHENGPDYIRGQFAQLVDLAHERGQALAICHFRPATARVLAELLPTLAQDGIELVHASELVQ